MMRCLLFLTLWAVAIGGAHAQVSRLQLTDKHLWERSDLIVVAECTERTQKISNVNLVTVYSLRPSEFMKGNAKLDKNGEMQIEELGGILTDPPIIQKPDGFADLVKGEEVLLFMKKHQTKAQDPNDPRYKSSQDVNGYRIVGRYQGRFTVIKHPATGQKIVAKPSGLTQQLRRLDQGRPTLSLKQTASGTVVAEQSVDAAAAKNSLQAKLDLALSRTEEKSASSARKGTDQGEVLSGFMTLDSVREKMRDYKLKSEAEAQ